MNNTIKEINHRLAAQTDLILSTESSYDVNQPITQKVFLERSQLPQLLKIIKSCCREGSTSFVFDNKRYAQKLLTLVSLNPREIAKFEIVLLSKKQASQFNATDWLSKNNKSRHFTFNKIRNRKLLTNNFITLIGPDGVGKSTVSSVIQKAIPAKTLRYKNTFRRSYLYKSLYFLHKNKQLEKNDYDDLHPNRTLLTSLLRLYSKSLFSFLSKKVILCDRYTNDSLASHLRAKVTPKASSKLSLKSKFIPAPKTIIQLDAPAKVVLSRRNELTEATINFLSDFYLESSFLIQPKKIIYLNTNIPFSLTQNLVFKLLSL